VNIPIYQIDAFANRPFTGNPAAVCPLEEWLDDSLMQSIAEENNLSETAFFVAEEKGFRIRWFTPVTEVDLCGHATLAAAHLILNILKSSKQRVVFHSKSGKLAVTQEEGMISMDFPARPPVPCRAPTVLLQGLGKTLIEVFASDDYMAVFSSEQEVAALDPDLERLKELDLRGVIVTARGDHSDFVSRFFAPKAGVPEDPVTGSAHCTLTPYWASKLGKNKLHALQVSKRGGELFCTHKGDRVLIAGRAVKVMEGRITL
jgi:PhzF family phenazine biosynthesis protein